MVVFPHAKINLGLHVLRKRSDGYHDIETVLFPVPLFDVLEMNVDDALPMNTVIYTRSGIPIAGDLEEDLCVKAVRQLQREQQLKGLRLHLHKMIPTGAGLGGGSSDGASALVLADRVLELGRTPEELRILAARLGSDCPFFLLEGAHLASGRGDQLVPIEIDLSDRWLLLVNPAIHISTRDAYGRTRPQEGQHDLRAALERTAIRSWKDGVTNDMEVAVSPSHPEIAVIRNFLDDKGAVYSAMSGSGSSVFGLFENEPDLQGIPGSWSAWKWRL